MPDPTPGADPTPAPEPDPTPAPEPAPAEDLAAEVEKWKHFARQHEKAAKANADAAAKLQAIEDAAKSQAEKDAEARAAAEQKAADLEAQVLRLKVAAAKKLPPELADRLIGSTEDEMNEDADRLLAVMKPTTPPAPAGGADQGPQGQPVKPADLDEQIRAAQAAGDHRLLIELNGRKLAAIHAASPT
ncbi:MAG TPA: hypothetical protein PKX25_14245 [Microthrixaceae bacterium]|nr:hypothetical protein [Microthrixaceae bacterium]HMX66730.1 hypothetical protein [Microthrixaceae bacterium]